MFRNLIATFARSANALGGALLALTATLPAQAQPRTPTDDAEVLERVPSRTQDPQARRLAELRAAWRRQPADPAAALALARRCIDDFQRESDPRLIGCAQAALATWWSLPDPPPEVRVQRAVVLQFSHRFDEALADLDAVLAKDAAVHEAWLWKTAILMVQARYAEARQACGQLAPLVSPLSAVGCKAQVDAATGAAAPAAEALRAALARETDASAAERRWALTRLAETEERLGRTAPAEAAFRAGLALEPADVYLLAAFSDFLLDQGRPAEVQALLARRERIDVLLLRLALAADRLRDAAAPRLKRELAARFESARRVGDALHEKEEARFALALQGDGRHALALARSNFKLQREPADARVLLEAALAMRDKAAAEPALRWLAESRIEATRLQALAAQLRELP